MFIINLYIIDTTLFTWLNFPSSFHHQQHTYSIFSSCPTCHSPYTPFFLSFLWQIASISLLAIAPPLRVNGKKRHNHSTQVAGLTMRSLDEIIFLIKCKIDKCIPVQWVKRLVKYEYFFISSSFKCIWILRDEVSFLSLSCPMIVSNSFINYFILMAIHVCACNFTSSLCFSANRLIWSQRYLQEKRQGWR